eukprot:scaffold21059_cov114-Skeletonema_dohrnii-CCMP3373.AAC.2
MATALAGLPRKVVVASGSSWLRRCVFGAGGKHVTRELQKLQKYITLFLQPVLQLGLQKGGKILL